MVGSDPAVADAAPLDPRPARFARRGFRGVSAYGQRLVSLNLNTLDDAGLGRDPAWSGADLEVRAVCWPDWMGGQRFIDCGDIEVRHGSKPDVWVPLKNAEIAEHARFVLVSKYTGHDYPDEPPAYM